MSDYNNEELQNENGFFSLQNLVKLFTEHWGWFLASVIFFMGAAGLYLMHQTPVYTRTAQLLIKDDESKGSSALDDIASLDLFSKTTNLNNELAVIQSPDLMTKVVNELGLNYSYSIKRRLRNVPLYGDSVPFKVYLTPADTTVGISFEINTDTPETYTLSSMTFGKEKIKGEIKGQFGKEITTPAGNITIIKMPAFKNGDLPSKIKFAYSTPYKCALGHCGMIKVTVPDKKASIIELSITTSSMQKGDDVLNTLIKMYNQDWIADKNQITLSTSQFINERLKVLQNELGEVDTDISNYKSQNLLPDVSAASNLYMQEATATNSRILQLNNQLYMARYVKDYLKNLPINQTLPINSGFESPSLTQQINDYNKLVLQRNNLLSVSGPENPVVADMSRSLEDLKTSINSSLANQIADLDKQLKTQQSYENTTVGKLASSPEQARHLLGVERQQKVKEELYLFLLQKLEENQLSLTYAAYNNRVIVQPNGLPVPTAPRKKIIFLGAFVIGLLLPLGFYFIRYSLITTIRSRADLEGINVPIVGEIPQFSARAGNSLIGRITGKWRPKKGDANALVVVEKGKRNYINEAFRMLRTSVGMLIGKEGKNGNVIAVTSFLPGSGKSFIAMNLGLTCGLNKKRVLLIDCDLRHGSLSDYVNNPSVGLTDYLAGIEPDINTIITHFRGVDSVDVIPIGKVPPNPTELLERPEFGELIDRLKGEYDIVLLDCPPYNVVADTAIITPFASRTMFIVRIGLCSKESISELETMRKNNDPANIAIIINGTPHTKSSYYSSKQSHNYYIED